MASWDYPAVAAPRTADYGAPLVDFNKIGDLPKDYYAGKEMQRQDEKANLFRNGIPKDAAGNIDVNSVTDKLARINPDYAMPLINMQIQGQMGQAAGDVIRNGGGQPGAQPTAAAQPNGGQPTAQPAPQRSAGPAPSQPAASGNSQPATVMTILAAQGVPNDQLQAASDSLSRQLGVAPTEPLDMQDPQVRNVLGAAIPRLKTLGQVVPDGQPAPTPVSATQDQPQATPASRIAQGFDAARPSSGRSDAPPQSPLVAQADNLDAQATAIRARAATYAAVNPKAAETLNKEADIRADKAKQLRDQGADAPAIKEWRQSGSKLPYDEWVAQAEGSKEGAKEDAKASAAKYTTLVENGTRAQQEIPQLELLQEQMNNDPNFFSGSGEKYNLLYKRLKSAVGIDPDAPVPQELLRKVTASNVLSSLGSLKGLGPIRVAEMNMAREAAASPDNSVPANKMLVEISKRTHQRNAEIADMAQAYKDQNGQLDPTFDKKVTAYYKDHPMFSDAEIKDWHRIIGEQPRTPAQAPAGKPAQMPTFASPAAVHAANLPSGTQFRDANGTVRMVP